MVKAIYAAARSLESKMRNTEIVATNLANVNSVGFKRQLPFSEILNRESEKPFKQLSDFSDGYSVATNNSMDVAIEGSALFVVKDDKGTHLTRDGRFKISEDGYLETATHQKVQGGKGEINLYDALLDKDKAVTISKNGEIRLGETYIDTLIMGKITSQENIIRDSKQGFTFEKGSFEPADIDDYKLSQGYIEESNVNPILEMESMINLNKDYEAAQKVIGYFDASLGKASEVGRL